MSLDSSVFDEICELCGACDARGSDRLYQPCPASEEKRQAYDEEKEKRKNAR